MSVKRKTYIISSEPNDQEEIIAFTDKEAMRTALKKFGIKLVELDPSGKFNHRKII